MPADDGSFSKNYSIAPHMKLTEFDVKKEDEEAIKRWDCGSPLYDSYELVALNHVIDRHLMELPCLSGSRKDPLLSHESSRSVIQSSLSSSSSSTEVASSKKFKGSSMKHFLSGLMERKVGCKRKVDHGERKEESKKVKWGIIKICNMISSWKKISYKDH